MSWSNGKRGHRKTECLRCGNLKFHEARGLCKCCYNKAWESKSLDAFPTIRERFETEADRVLRTLHPVESVIPASLGRKGLYPWKIGGMQ